MQIHATPTPYVPKLRKSVLDRWQLILDTLPPGKYTMKVIASRCNVNYRTLATMLDDHNHPQIIAPKSSQGKTRTVTILAFPQIHFKPIPKRYPSPYTKPTNSHGQVVKGGRR